MFRGHPGAASPRGAELGKVFGGAGAWLPPLFILAAITAAYADDFPPEARQQEHVQVTATRRAKDEFDVAAASSGVSGEAITAQNPDVVAGALRGLPGVWFQQTTPGQGVPIIRGLKGSEVLHLVDGMRLNNALFRNAPNQYLGLLDPQWSRSVEVVRGAAGTLYGSDAMGGVVNVLTREPELGGDPAGAESRIYAGWRSVDHALTGRYETRVSREQSALQIGAGYAERGNRETGSGITLRPSGFRARSLDAKWLQQLGEASDLMVSIQAYEQPSTPRVDELVAGFGQDEPTSEEFFFEPNRRHFGHLRLRMDDGGWFDRFQLNLARQVIDDDRRSRDAGEAMRRLEQNRSTLDGLTLQFDHDDRLGGAVTWGAEWYGDTVDSERISVDLDTGERSLVRSRFPDGSTLDSMAVFVSGDWLITPRLDVNAGLRYSAFDIDLASTATSPGAKLDPDDFTGDLRLVWSATKSTHVVAGVGRGFRAPNIFDLGTLGDRPGNRFNIANPALGPETVWSYDLGIKHRSERLELEAYLFHMDYRDKITSVLTGGQTSSGRDIVRAENRNSVRINGIEAGFRIYPSDAWTIEGSLNWTRGTEREPGADEPADRIPPLNGRLSLNWADSERLSVEGTLLFAGRQDRLSARDQRDPRINPDGTPGWTTLGLSMKYRLDEGTDLGLRLDNITDNAYREHASGLDAPGRSLGLWLSHRF